jgi:hypothetical protein
MLKVLFRQEFPVEGVRQLRAVVRTPGSRHRTPAAAEGSLGIAGDFRQRLPPVPAQRQGRRQG